MDGKKKRNSLLTSERIRANNLDSPEFVCSTISIMLSFSKEVGASGSVNRTDDIREEGDATTTNPNQ